MPDYTIPLFPIKRLRYFNNQFLNENDFIDDQAAHLAHERAQLRALCTPGVCEGFVVSYPGAVTAAPSISPGIAIDNAGRMIVLKDAINGPSPAGLAVGEYLVHVRFNEVTSDPSANQGGPGDTRFLSQPLFGATLKTVALPAGAIVLASFTTTTVGQINAHTDAGRQFSGLRLPGPGTTVPVLRNDGTVRGDSSTDSALLSGTLTVRRDVTAALGATLTLTNGRPAPGATTAGTAIDLNACDPASNAPSARIQSLGDGNHSSHVAILTKAPGAANNALVERLRVASDGAVTVSGDVTAAAVTGTMHRMTAIAAAAAQNTSLFANTADNELYWRTSGGTNVKLTSGAALNAAAFVGGIGGDYLTAGALASFDDANDTFAFQQQGGPRPWARMRSGDVDIYQTAANITNRVRLQSPASLAASYALTLPAALPSGKTPLMVDASGVISTQSNTINYPASLAVAGGGNETYIAGSGWEFNTSTTGLTCPIALRVGSVISSWKVYLQKGTSLGNINARLVDFDMSTFTATTSATVASTGSGVITINGTATATVAANHHYYLLVIGTGAGTIDWLLGWSVVVG